MSPTHLSLPPGGQAVVLNTPGHFRLPILLLEEGRHVEIEIRLAAPAVYLEVIGLAFCPASSASHLRLNVCHQSRNSHSVVDIRSLVARAGQYEFHGSITIPSGMSASSTRLQQESLLLSPTARARAIPSLDITEHEVQASHGVAVGRASEFQRFYLESRGMDPAEALQAVVQGFVRPVSQHFSAPDRATIEKIIPKLIRE